MRTVNDLFESTVARMGDRPALITPGGTVGYARLNADANRLARRLVAAGVGPDTLVAVAVPRTAGLMTVLLAVLKAGGAYLPLDPAYPAERLSFMLRDARPVLLVRSSEAHVPGADIPELLIDDPAVAAACAAQPHHDLTDRDRRAPLRPGHLMYVIYTSGSTGRPKGVAVTHSGVAALAASQAAELGAGPGDRVLQWASISFDAAFWDICLALLSGAALVLAPAGDLLPGPPLHDTMRRNAVTHATLPPVALSVTDAAGLLPGGVVMSTGDAVTRPLATTWSAGRRMFNGYGPTEVTVGIAMGPITGREEISIGRPLLGSAVHVLDERLGEAAPDAEGELYLAGPGLARGYLGRPAETAARFVADPYGPAGSRMYRSGDRGRRRADGELFFAGRADDQVKIRGFRVELGEIEARLSAHPAVELACAVVEGGLAEARVVAYARTRPGDPVTGADLRAHLAAALPAHMVPAAVVVLESFPTLPNGKIDRAALRRAPAPAAAGDDVCGLAAEILGVPEARPEDNFFDLGGHSVLATLLARRIRREFGVSVPIRSIFEAATLADIEGLVQAGS
ncbi:non-ribosomal peptide synthetase [Actinomadura sp. ATCC 31491]|uniref:Non-ribosomal peptide synthetase n=1 Tax=Actinomadura luzonensis TaxID=2805427 RepID=A0ABT0FV95_9ACTN|nr:non-ribosomal peptide synthetase [Actinomadura luzonensis]MCK2216179.1 non-ribosomal peptide synthetase [Actinomadura luzonensis]UKU09930.1 Luz3 [Actinomadura luzonensis]